MSLFDELDNSAVLSPDGVYRYVLRREWADGQCVAFLMFNPSTADASLDDPTIRKCRGFARQWGYGRMVIVNLFTIRSTDPRKVSRTVDPVGPMGDYYTVEALDDARELICAWGCGSHMKGSLAKRPAKVLGYIRERHPYLPIQCLGRGADGSPRHPLMLGYATKRVPYETC